MIGIPATFGLFAYSEKIFGLLFPNAKQGYELLELASIGLTFSLLTQTINGILQGLGENKVPVYVAMIGVIIKVLANIILIPINGIYEKGAIIGNVLSAIVSFIIVYIVLKRKINLKPCLFKIVIKLIVLSSFMIITSLYIYKILIISLNKNISTIIAIISAIIIYSISIFVTKMINKNQILETVGNTEKN